MDIFIGTEENSVFWKNEMVEHLTNIGYQTIDVGQAKGEEGIFASIKKLVEELKTNLDSLAIFFEPIGIASFIIANKYQSIVATTAVDERSAYMTRAHNNTRLLIIPTDIVGTLLAREIVVAFVRSKYEAGRHQIRIDMLNEMY